MTASVLPVVGPFRLRSALFAWGFGWSVGIADPEGEDDLPPVNVVRTPWDGEMPLQVALESAARARWHHANVPRLLRRGDQQGTPWMSFQPVAAVRIEQLLSAPVPVHHALALAGEITSAFGALDAARRPDEASPAAIGARLSEVLVTLAGTALVVTPPPGTRMTRPGLLAQTQREPLLVAPELLRGNGSLTPRTIDIYAAGAALAALLFPDGRTAELERELPGRVRDVVNRATMIDPGERYESWDELLRALLTAAEDFPPVEAAERSAFAQQRAGRHLEDARRQIL